MREGGRRRGRHVWLVVAMVALIPAMLCGLLLLRDRRPADERLAEIEADRAVPDAQNAALIYNELLQDPRALSVLDSRPGFLDGTRFCKRRDEPWRSEEDPEVAAWIDEWAPALKGLAEASQLDACRFPISIDLVVDQNTMDQRSAMRQWATLLRFAVSNDLGEGCLDDAVTKWRCLIQMGNHLRQQPCLVDHMTAYAITKIALESLVRFVVTGDPSARHLQELEAMPLPQADNWQQHRDRISEIDRLRTRKMKESFTLWGHLTYPIASYRMKRAMKQAYPDQKKSPTESTGNWYRQSITTARGLRILVALRRHRTDIGQWPESLDEIRMALPETTLTDPLNGDSFVYRRTEDAVELYSRGKNKIDETIRRGSDHSDDWPIWPLPEPKPKPEPKPADREAEERMMKQLKEIYGEDALKLKQEDANGV